MHHVVALTRQPGELGRHTSPPESGRLRLPPSRQSRDRQTFSAEGQIVRIFSLADGAEVATGGR